jgi:hypothetical protein
MVSKILPLNGVIIENSLYDVSAAVTLEVVPSGLQTTVSESPPVLKGYLFFI